MSKKSKVRPFPGQRAQLPALMPPQGGPEVKQKITEIDGYKYRLAVQKEQTLIAKQNEIQRYKDLLVREEENLRLRIALLQMENARDIGHLHLEQGDKVNQEGEDWYVVRAPRKGPVPKIGSPVAPPKPEVPEQPELPPPPTAEDAEEEDDDEEESEEKPESAPEEQAK